MAGGESDDDFVGPPVPDYIKQQINDIAEDSSDDDDVIGPPVPKQFQTGSDKDDVETDDDMIGPTVPKQFQTGNDKDGVETDDDMIGPPVPKQNTNHDSDNDVSDEENPSSKIPVSNDVSIFHGHKAVSAIAVDPAGARLATGSIDYDVMFWDFAGMDRTLQSFRTMNPCGNHPIKALQYSTTGDAILIISGTSQAKVLDRDGHEVLECVKGDQYIADMSRTKGHTSALTGGCWHPRQRDEFLTSSEDSTCRLWDVTRQFGHKNVIKCRAKNGLKTTPTACTYNRDGTLVVSACIDGSIQMWDHRKMFVNTTHMLRDAHQPGSETSCISFSYVGSTFATRSCDDTLKLWDLRSFKKPISVVNDLYSRYAQTECTFSPDNSLIVTGASLKRNETAGKLLFFDSKTLNKVKEITVTDSHTIRTVWHPRLQQIFVGCGNGIIKIFYNDKKSMRGAKLCATKKRTKTKQVEVVAAQQIITPHALPMFRQDKPKSNRKRLEKDRLDPVKSHRPDLPIKSGQGGRVAASGSTLSSYVIRNLGLSKKIEDDQDPREAILRFAKEAEENPYWIAPAYKNTQPTTIFQNSENEDDETVDEPSSKKQKT